MTTPTDAAPDLTTTDLTCPLCGYSLRGLATPRCPECGFAFQWQELLDAERDRHPWLFEHGRRRNVRTFLATYGRDALPRRFWRAVTPANGVHVGRLLVYWVLTAVLAAAMTNGVGPVAWVVGLARSNLQFRARFVPVPGQPGMVRFRNNDPRRGSGPAWQLDAVYPVPWKPAFWSEAGRGLWQSGPGRTIPSYDWSPSSGTTTAIVLAWPPLTLAALLVFQASMRRAKVRPAHVLRVAVYGCDCGLLCAAALAGFHGLMEWQPFYQWLGWGRAPVALLNESTFPVVVILVACSAATTYRLTIAYRQYLRFDRPGRTALAAQAMVLLAVAVAVLRWTNTS